MFPLGYYIVPWSLIFQEAVAALAVTASVRTRFTLPTVNLYTTFYVRITAFTAGTVAVLLRFGFTDAEADAATEGITFTALGAANASEYRSQGWTPGAAVPNAPGSAPSIHPPRCSVQITAAGPATLTYQVHYVTVGVV